MTGGGGGGDGDDGGGSGGSGGPIGAVAGRENEVTPISQREESELIVLDPDHVYSGLFNFFLHFICLINFVGNTTYVVLYIIRCTFYIFCII